MTPAIASPAGSVVLRQEFGAQEIQQHGSLAPLAAAASARAEIEARIVAARSQPRNIDHFEQKIMHLC